MRIVAIAGAAVVGIFLVFTLSLAEGLRAEIIGQSTAGGMYAGIVLAMIASTLGFALVTKTTPTFAFVLAGTMVACLVVGLFTYSAPIAAIAPVTVLDLSTLLTRAASSLSPWVIACGVAVIGIHQSANRRKIRRQR